jgi:hypothetical protein
MKNQDSKITDTLPFKQDEYTRDVEEYMKSPTEDLFYKLRKYRKQCIEYLKRHPDDFNMQTNLIDLNYLGIFKSKPPVQETKPQNIQEVVGENWVDDAYYL